MTEAGPVARSTPKARRTRARILDSSLLLFQEKGFHETSMRDIAARAGLSLGATYYHFRSKDDLVFAFYARTQEDAEREALATLAATSNFEERLRSLLAMRLDHLAVYRGFFSVLANQALDFNHPLSPFGSESEPTRERAIEIMRRAMEGSDLRVHETLRPRLPLLLWLLQMGLIFLWVHDQSEAQVRTRRITDLCLGLLTRLLALSAAPIPGLSRVVSLLDQLIGEILELGARSGSSHEEPAQ